MRSKFKDEHKLEKRKAEADRIRQKYADRIPVSPSHTLAPSQHRQLTHLRLSAKRSKNPT